MSMIENLQVQLNTCFTVNNRIRVLQSIIESCLKIRVLHSILESRFTKKFSVVQSKLGMSLSDLHSFHEYV